MPTSRKLSTIVAIRLGYSAEWRSCPAKRFIVAAAIRQSWDA